jgi:hypothetical protein
LEKEIVELMPAFFWICPECGIDNFIRSMVPTMNERDEEEFKRQVLDEHGVDLSESHGMFMLVPEKVKCSGCDIEFKTIPYNVGEPGGDIELGGDGYES